MSNPQGNALFNSDVFSFSGDVWWSGRIELSNAITLVSEGNLMLSGASLEVRGDLGIDQDFWIDENSYVVIYGNLNVRGDLVHQNNFYVTGIITVGGTREITTGRAVVENLGFGTAASAA